MARSINEIKEEAQQEFMKNGGAAERYGFEPGANFGDYFGAVSVENILLYVWAVCAWTVEQLVDRHRVEVKLQLDELTPHRPKWYRDKVLEFMCGKELIADTDRYDTEGMSVSEIEAARVVKHAVATESRDSSLLTIKVAGEKNGKREPLSEDEENKLELYIGEIKDAGVRVKIVNITPGRFDCRVDVYYNPLLDCETVREACAEAIKRYVENLPFNGEYTNMGLIDALQEVEGVRIAELVSAVVEEVNGDGPVAINARLTPAAGYLEAGEIIVNMLAYEQR